MSNRINVAVMGSILVGMCLLGGCARTIHQAAANGEMSIVKSMVDKDATLITAQDEPGKWTPLHHAVAHGHKDVVQYLLEHGADPLAKARGGWTPLHEARQDGQLTIEKMLIKAIKDSGRQVP